MKNAQPPKHVMLVGCGKMGGALLKCWQRSFPETEFTIIAPNNPLASFKTTSEAAEALANSELVILAVKPQIMNNICAELKPHIVPSTTIISIAAGQTLATLESYFAKNQPIIRTMPNTPASIGQGVTLAIANATARDNQKDTASALFEAAGAIAWLDDEAMMNAATTISGCGPAYVFHLIETLTQSGISLGLPVNLSETLARQTVIGSAALAEAEPDISASELRKNVTSKGGMTAAALEVLMSGDLQEIYNTALNAAKTRGENLNS